MCVPIHTYTYVNKTKLNSNLALVLPFDGLPVKRLLPIFNNIMHDIVYYYNSDIIFCRSLLPIKYDLIRIFRIITH